MHGYKSERMKETFSVDKSSNIAIYGAGRRSLELCNVLIASDYNICCIVDREPFVENYMSIPVVSVEDFEKEGNDGIILIIGLQDGCKHEEIAKWACYKCHIGRILYIPTKYRKSLADMQTIRRAYNDLLNGEYSKLHNIPQYYELKNELIVIELGDKRISFWCPSNILYTQTVEDVKRVLDINPNRDEEQQLSKYLGVKLNECSSYQSLIKWDRKEIDYPEDYVRMHQLEGYSFDEEILLNNRVHLLEKYRFALKFDMSFFIDSPCLGTVRDNRLIITDGCHRASFLISEGYEFVPVSISVEEYDDLLDMMKKYED